MKFGQLLIKSSLIATLLAFTGSAFADTAIRCKSKLAKKGDNQYKFFKVCGEPDFVEKRTVYRTLSIGSSYGNQYHSHDEENPSSFGGQKVSYNTTRGKNHHRHDDIRHEEEEEIQIEKWTYDFGPNRLIQQVRFINGVADRISSQGKGFKRR